jgi:hypothetical protein
MGSRPLELRLNARDAGMVEIIPADRLRLSTFWVEGVGLTVINYGIDRCVIPS